MKLLFLIFHGFDEANGISKKIRYQTKALRECGADVRMCYYQITDDGNRRWMVNDEVIADLGSGKMAKAKKRFFFRPICEYAQREGIELVYIRSFHNANPFTINLIKELKRQVRHVVMEIPKDKFEHILQEQKAAQGVTQDQELSVESLLAVIDKSKALYRQEIEEDFPEDVTRQLFLSIEAVFRSWNNHRAIVYRNLNKIDHNLGTAVNIQAMVFGNMGEDSGSGVAFSRNPSTGERKLYGEYLINAQGEDVVAGVRTPRPIAELGEDMPEIFEQFRSIAEKLERHYRDMQDIELTIERGKLYILQTRNGKRTAQAALKIAHDMVGEGLIDKKEALLRIDPEHLAHVLHRQIDSSADLTVLAAGLAASPGAAFGSVVFDANEAEHLGRIGSKVILVRVETTPDDIHGIVQAQGILTSRGGMTSHAAVVTRGMGKPCVCGCEAVKVDYEQQLFTVGSTVVRKGELISIDGTTGQVILGAVPLKDPELSKEYQTILEWADEVRTLQVRANADTPEDAEKSRKFGAQGIGLTRTEHMFMAQERLPYVQRMILATTTEERMGALLPLRIMQENDFYSHILHDDLDSIVRDIREAHLKDKTTADPQPTLDEVKENFEQAIQMGTDTEAMIHEFCDKMQIPFEKISSEDFSAFLRILSLSKLLKKPNNMRGKAKSQPYYMPKKKKRR